MDLPVIEENVAGNEEEETLRTNKGLYRPPHRSSLSRDSSVQRKNRGIIQNAGLAAPLRAGGANGLSNLPPNYKAGNYHSSNVVTNAHSAQVKSNPKLSRELKAEPSTQNVQGDKLKNGLVVHDTKTPIILSQKARYMREQQE